MIHSSQTHSVDSKKTQEYLSGWQRSRAELDNMRKSIAARVEVAEKQSKRKLVEELLQLSDNFNAIAEHVPEKLVDDGWTQGVLHVAKQLQGILNDYDLRIIEAEGKKFDPNIHEAIEKVKKKGGKSGYVTEVVRPGYMIGNDVLRPAKVKISI